jgi:hypothetical protein
LISDSTRDPLGSRAADIRLFALYGGLEVSDAKRLKALEDENAKLKKLLAEAQRLRHYTRLRRSRELDWIQDGLVS